MITMPCLFVLLALATPRVVIILLYLFSNWFHGVFPSAFWPVLGFIFLPTSTLWFSAVHNWWGGHWGVIQIIGMIIALFIDTSSSAAGRRSRRSREES